MTKLIIATRNKKKLKEIKRLLKNLPIKVLDLSQIKGKIPQIKEDKKTFIANAKKKALAISKLYKDALVLADDSGLSVNCLAGVPGVNSARYAGASQNDDRNISKLLKNMKKVGAKRGAFFNCTVVIAKDGRAIASAVGKVHGTIAKQRHGSNGFGYDPIFIPKGHKKTFAQMNPSFKNRISHRGKALKKVRNIIQKYLREYP